MDFNAVNPTHGSIKNVEPNTNRSEKELAKRIMAAAVGVITTLGSLFALLTLGTPVLFAAGTAILIGGISLKISLTFLQKKIDSVDTQTSQQIQRNKDRQLQQHADFCRQKQELEAERERLEIAFIQMRIKNLNLEKAGFDQSFKNRNLDDPIVKQVYETQLSALNSKYKRAFTFTAEVSLSPDAKARILAPYQAEYSHLM